MRDLYIYPIVALLPITALVVVWQKNPYNALVLRGYLGQYQRWSMQCWERRMLPLQKRSWELCWQLPSMQWRCALH